MTYQHQYPNEDSPTNLNQYLESGSLERPWAVVQERTLLSDGAYYDEDIKVVKEHLSYRSVVKVTIPTNHDRDICIDLYMNHLTAKALRDQLDVFFDDTEPPQSSVQAYAAVVENDFGTGVFITVDDPTKENVERVRQALSCPRCSSADETEKLIQTMRPFLKAVNKRVRISSQGWGGETPFNIQAELYPWTINESS